MQVRDVMSREVQATTPHTSLREAAELMKELDVGPLPVCDGARLIGMITDRDIIVRAVADGQDCFEGKVRDVMSMDVAFCREEDDITVATRLMREKQVRRLPVLDRDQRLIGIIALSDVALNTGDTQAAAQTLQAVSEPNR